MHPPQLVLCWRLCSGRQVTGSSGCTAGSDAVTKGGLTLSPSWKPLAALPSSRRLLRFLSRLQGEGAHWWAPQAPAPGTAPSLAA